MIGRVVSEDRESYDNLLTDIRLQRIRRMLFGVGDLTEVPMRSADFR